MISSFCWELKETLTQLSLLPTRLRYLMLYHSFCLRLLCLLCWWLIFCPFDQHHDPCHIPNHSGKKTPSSQRKHCDYGSNDVEFFDKKSSSTEASPLRKEGSSWQLPTIVRFYRHLTSKVEHGAASLSVQRGGMVPQRCHVQLWLPLYGFVQNLLPWSFLVRAMGGKVNRGSDRGYEDYD